MSHLLIMNPGARSGRGKKLWAFLEQSLRGAGIKFESVETSAPEDAFRFARAAKGRGTIVAVGGDGTINGVLDGVVQSGDPEVRMGVLYTGTSPDFCRFNRIPVEPQAAVRTLLADLSSARDVGRITFYDGAGKERAAHFGCSCNIGLGAAVARQANLLRGSLGDALGTGLAAVRAFLAGAPADLELEIDGESVSLKKVNNLTVVKNPLIASGIKLNLPLCPDDGRFWVFAVHGKSRAGMLGLLPGAYSGNIAGRDDVFKRQCRSVKVKCAGSQEIEFDGDPRGWLPVSIELVPKALRLISDPL
ncbi:MAG TPA: diacylglycerol kinase family protein [Elusimicrobiales bacterium]|nr:diacylglycerol kinase family protein [Elusimicrobiales bacterium]